ncbi:amphi-Trp domain-containing protein [bacterium]|nr:amphi-Trp domain-containing protein [bacterium]
MKAKAKAKPQKQFDREIERNIRSKTFAKLLTRIATALNKNQSVRVAIKGSRIAVPKNAKLSVVHEKEGSSHELELQFSWKDIKK